MTERNGEVAGPNTPEELEKRRRMMACLSQVRSFIDLSEADKEELVDLLQEQQPPKGHIVFEQGDEADGLYLLERGEVVAQIAEGEKFRDMTTFKGRDYFGEMALLSDDPRSARALITSEEGATMYFLPRAGFERFLLTRHVSVMRQFVSSMSSRLAEEAEIQIPPDN